MVPFLTKYNTATLDNTDAVQSRAGMAETEVISQERFQSEVLSKLSLISAQSRACASSVVGGVSAILVPAVTFSDGSVLGMLWRVYSLLLRVL